MNHKKIKKQIKKINSFFESITDDDEISKIEKDLLLSYIRKLYESVLDHDDNVAAKPRKEAKPSKPAPVKKKATAAVSKRKPFERTELVETIVEEVKNTVPIQEEVKEAVTSKAPEVKEKTTKAPVSVVLETSKVEISEKMASIFEKSGGTELSDRLGNLPLKDLTKAMGINERLFTIKELFGGNQDRFKTVMSDINKLSGYDEAKDYLISGVATELEWDSEVNFKKADKFVKLVQRRFS